MEYYRIGLITRPHGVHGNVRVQPLTDDSERFRGMCEAYLEQDGVRRMVALSDISVQPDAVLLRLAGFDSREAAEKLRGAYLCVDKANAVPLPPGRYFIADLIGCRVEDTEGRVYGLLKDVLQTGANDVYEIEGEIPILLPALKRVLLEVDTERKHILLDAAVVKEVAIFAD